jgi:hypothetical protein
MKKLIIILLTLSTLAICEEPCEEPMPVAEKELALVKRVALMESIYKQTDTNIAVAKREIEEYKRTAFDEVAGSTFQKTKTRAMNAKIKQMQERIDQAEALQTLRKPIIDTAKAELKHMVNLREAEKKLNINAQDNQQGTQSD